MQEKSMYSANNTSPPESSVYTFYHLLSFNGTSWESKLKDVLSETSSLDEQIMQENVSLQCILRETRKYKRQIESTTETDSLSFSWFDWMHFISSSPAVTVILMPFPAIVIQNKKKNLFDLLPSFTI